jgi:AGCS family alanine or glycine:cation symporter
VIFSHFSELGRVINDIFSSAFTPYAAVGGGVSYIALREGFARGILSNEAGAGTSALAHSQAPGRSPHTAGLFAMCEVVFDSSLLCMLTGIAVLAAVPDYAAYRTPMSLVKAAFHSVFGSFSDLFLPLIILAFAYSTIICWYFYGVQTCRSYFGRFSPAFAPIFVLFLIFCSVIPQISLIYTTDLLLLIMAVLTLSAILVRAPRIISLCKYKKAPD